MSNQTVPQDETKQSDSSTALTPSFGGIPGLGMLSTAPENRADNGARGATAPGEHSHIWDVRHSIY